MLGKPCETSWLCCALIHFDTVYEDPWGARPWVCCVARASHVLESARAMHALHWEKDGSVPISLQCGCPGWMAHRAHWHSIIFFRLGGVPLNLRRQRWHTTYDHHCGDHMVISICSMVAMKVIVLTVLTPPSMRTLFSCWWCNWFRWFWAFLWRLLHWSTKHASLVRPIVAWTQQGPKQDVASVDTER